MVIYYSGTGNSAHCARETASALGDECISAFAYIKNGIAAEFSSARPWVFVSPTYGWRLPGVFADFIRSARLSGCREAYFVMTCGSEIGNAEKYLRELCREKHLAFRGVLQVVMPENYIALFSAPDAQEAERIIACSRPVLEAGIDLIRRGEPFPETHPGAVDRLKSGPVNRLFCRYIVRDGPFRAGDSCISCGKCAEVCPVNDIAISGGRPVWQGHCTHCMACISRCPVRAIEYGRSTRDKERYFLDK